MEWGEKILSMAPFAVNHRNEAEQNSEGILIRENYRVKKKGKNENTSQ